MILHGCQEVVIAIDGPAGSGKSSVAREVARRLGFTYIDSGATYRALGLLALRRGWALDDAKDLERLAQTIDLRFTADRHRWLVGEEDITESIRTPEISHAASVVSTIAGVRQQMVALQRRLGGAGNVVMDGRDIGTVVFPNAEVKVFLSASPEERARRRFAEKPDSPPRDEVLRQIRERDARDSSREHAPLRPAPDAVIIDSTSLSLEQVVDEIEALTRLRRPQ